METNNNLKELLINMSMKVTRLNNAFMELDSQMSPFINKILNNNNQIRTLEKLRDTLLPKLINGEVRVEYEKN